MSCQFPRAVVTRYQTLGGLMQQKVIVVDIWRLQVQNQGVHRAMLPLREALPASQARVFVGNSSPFHGLETPPSDHMATFSLCLHLLLPLCVFVSASPTPHIRRCSSLPVHSTFEEMHIWLLAL